ncbi:hypothetical protein LTR97_004671 [Elasticomyces elasticus]|uniref:Uncharacterized protein n=1 Tax=Elasticomyces elasticus TaxID=574655 RepID=A0AAN7VTT9_9PEZI|nr:hypothetical protein LTR97_004671 [Elasticomyces elasticus]
MGHHRRIYWKTPTTVWVAFATGILLACGHHIFYTKLDRTRASTGNFDLRFGKISKQQLNISIGTALAFLVKAMLTSAVSVSYVQLFWHAMKRSRKALPLPEVDNAFYALQDMLGIFHRALWQRYPLLILLALIFWLLAIPSVITAGTLSVQPALDTPLPTSMVSVPDFDFVNFNFAEMFRGASSPGGTGSMYIGPSLLAQKVAAATAAEGKILSITPPAPNSSWTLDFWGPSLRCDDVAAPLRRAILNNYGAALSMQPSNSSDCIANGAYVSWVSQGLETPEILPYVDYGNGEWYPQGYPEPNGTAQPLFVAIDGRDMPDNCSNASIQASGGWSSVFRHMTLLRCDLVNTSYEVAFQYTNGFQDVTVSKNSTSQDNIVIPQRSDVFLPYGPFDTWGNATCPPGEPTQEDAWCINQTNFKELSYTGIADAFNNLIIGESSPAAVTGTDIPVEHTVLMLTKELAVLSGYDGDQDEPQPPAIGRSVFPLRGSLGPLSRALEQLFENITISMLSEPYLLPNHSSPFAPPRYKKVTFTTYHNIYVYDPITLWTAYGIAILLTAIAVGTGTYALWTNGVAYDTNFSTVLRTSRLSKRLKGVDEELAGEDGQDDDGSRPLPDCLANATIIITTGRSRQAQSQFHKGVKAGIMAVESNDASDVSLLPAHDIPGLVNLPLQKIRQA